MMITTECLKPFTLSQAPSLTLSFSCASNAFRVPLQLPLTISSFFEPIPLDKATYMARWKALEGADKEVQEVFESSRPVTPELVTYIRTTMFSALRIAATADIDSDLTATGCGTLKTGTIGPDGSTPIVVGAMLRLEGAAPQKSFRITVRAANKTVASSIRDIHKTQLA